MPWSRCRKQVVDDRVEERFRLARAGAGRNQDVLPGLDRLEYLLLVQVHRRIADQPGHDGVQNARVGHLLNRFALGEGFRERNERPLDQGNVERRRPFQQLAGLLGKFRVGQRERREQVPQELVADGVGKLDWVDGHGQSTPLARTRERGRG